MYRGNIAASVNQKLKLSLQFLGLQKQMYKYHGAIGVMEQT